MKYFNSTIYRWLRNYTCVILLTFLSVTISKAQCSLACNGSTQVSIDINCEANITAEMILNDQATSCSSGNFVVTLSNDYGDIPNPIVDASYVGQDLYAKVTDTNSGNSCWGDIILEDKLGPLLDMCPTAPIDLGCSDFSVLEGPVYIDACEGLSEPILLSESVDPICDPSFIKVITREYTAVDSKGNKAQPCTITYRLLRIDFNDVNCPDSYSEDNGNSLSCDGLWSAAQLCDKSDLFTVLDTDTDGDGINDVDLRWDDNNNGYPDPEEVGAPTIFTTVNGEPAEVSLYPFPDIYCNSTVLFTDVELPRVGCSRKIMRTWTLREWHCNGEQTYTCPTPQILEIRDNTPPVVSCPESLQLSTNTIMSATNTIYGSVTCGASLTLPLPTATDNCSNELRIDLKYDGGIEKDYTGSASVILPMGINSVEYVVYDECYMSSSCFVQVEVIDITPPVAVCDQFTAVSLTTGGSALVKASTFDDGSYDDCKEHCMVARRMTPDTDNCDCKIPEFCDLNFIGENNGSYYYLSDYSTSATIARKRAEAYGGTLAMFETQAEEDWLVSRVRQGYGDRFWLGMKRFGNSFLWDNHDALSYENWRDGRPQSSETTAVLGSNSVGSNVVLFSDGATVDNDDDMVSNLTIKQGPSASSFDISWNWFASTSGGFTTENGINFKLLYYNGNVWKTLYSKRYTGTNTTNTIAPFLDITQTGSFRFNLPADSPCGTHFFRLAIEDNAFTSDVIVGNFATDDCDSHFDNADASFEVTSSQCIGDCVMMTPAPYNEWNDASCVTEIPYILEIKDICGFSQAVKFCCSDVGTDQMVVFRVIDIFGNYNDCMVNVNVQDKAAPSLICPPNEVVDCDVDFNASNLTPQFGFPTVLDDCGADVTEEGLDEITTCNLGTYTRLFTATDDGGRTSTCKQIITFVNPDIANGISNVVCPKDTVLVGCMLMADLSPEEIGFPEFDNSRCGMIATNYDDEVFTFNTSNGNSCFKVLRNWEIIDWCQSSLPISSCVQVLKVTYDVAPEITVGDSIEMCTYDSECMDGFIELSASGSSSCTSMDDLRWSYSVYAGELGVGPKTFTNPILEESGEGSETGFSGDFPIGTHVVVWTFFDRCGNATSKNQTFTIYNCKAPTAYCISGIAVDLMPMDFNNDGVADFGMVELWASDFNAGSSHPCGYEVFLSFSADTSDRFIQFDCTSRGDTLIEVWASVVGFNGTLNQSFCTSLVNVQDNNNACQGQREETVNVEGAVFTETLENVGDVNITLEGSPLTELTDVDGEYAFPDMPMGGDYLINPSSNLNPLNGVSTLDLVEIQRHVLGIQKFDSPYKIIAADINKDKKLTALDLLELRKLILGVYNELPNNDSWRFVDSEYKFINPEDPFSENFTEDYYISKLETDMEVDFIAVKVGDVNDSASASLTGSSIESRSLDVTSLEIENQSFEIGDVLQIPVVMKDENIEGFQLTMDFDNTKLLIESIEGSDGTLFTNSNYRLLDHSVAMSWNNVAESNEKAFVINAIALKEGELSDVLRISDDVVKAELYKNGGQLSSPKLNFGNDEIINEFELYQNSPNPFTDETTVNFVLGNQENVEITITDIQGRQVKRIKETFNKGINTITLNSDELGYSGVYYLTLKTNNNIATIKMVAIK